VHRVCFTLQVRTDRLEQYKRRHAAVWPDMLAALHEAGWRDYSLFLREDGLLVGYFLTEDLAAARAAMEATDVNRRWQAEMAEFFTSSEGAAGWRPDRGMHVLEEVFNLEDQLAAQR
jgi:L-rhamnose mutarotase